MKTKTKRRLCLLMAFVMIAGLFHVSADELSSPPYAYDENEEKYSVKEFIIDASNTTNASYTSVSPMSEDELIWSLDINRLNEGVSEAVTQGTERALIGGTLDQPTYLPGVRLRNSGTPANTTISAVHGATPHIEITFGSTNRFMEIQTGVLVGGTQDQARAISDAFTPVPGVTYRMVMNASMAQGTGGFRMRANAGSNNDSDTSWMRIAGLSATPQQVTLQWRQTATGGNIVIDNGTASNGMNPEPTADSPRTLILSDIRIFRVENTSETGYVFQLQEHIANLPLGCIGSGTIHLAPTHSTNEVTVEVRETAGTRHLFVERTATNNTRGLLLRGLRLQQGDIVTVTGNLLTIEDRNPRLRMRVQSEQDTGYLADNGTPVGTGSFTLSYTVSSDHAGRENQNLRIIPWASGSGGGNVSASFRVDDITVFRTDTSTPRIRTENPEMLSSNFRIESPYKDVNWETWFQFRAAHHTHTQRSDGAAWTRETVLDYYNRGYDILAITDHNVICSGDWTVNPPARPTVFWWQPMLWNDTRNLMSAAEFAAVTDGTWQTGTGRELPSGSRFSALGFLRPQMRTILGMPPGQPGVGILSTPFSNENSTRDHTLTFWANVNAPDHWTDDELLRQVGLAGGVAVFAHPGRHTCSRSGSDRCSEARDGVMCTHAGGRGHIAASNMPREVNRYVTRFTNYPHAVGMEVYNRPDHETRSDRILWDNILLQTMPEGRNVWGFANDDSHSMDGSALGWNVMLMPSLTDENHRTSMETGAFYIVSRVDRRLDVNENASTSASSSWHAPLMNRQAPAIRNISVEGQTITITGVNYDEIIWVTGNPFRANGSNNMGGGVIIAEGESIDLSELGKFVWGNYVRAVLICRTGHGSGINSHGVALTQPFGVYPSGGPLPTPTTPAPTPTTPAPTPTTPAPTPTTTPPAKKTLRSVTAPVMPTLTKEQSQSVETVINALPLTTEVTFTDDTTDNISFDWTPVNQFFNVAQGATNFFTWNLILDDINSDTVSTSGTGSVINFACPPNCDIMNCCKFVTENMNVQITARNIFSTEMSRSYQGTEVSMNVTLPPQTVLELNCEMVFSVQNSSDKVAVPFYIHVSGEKFVHNFTLSRDDVNTMIRQILGDDNAVANGFIQTNSVTQKSIDTLEILKFEPPVIFEGNPLEFNFVSNMNAEWTGDNLPRGLVLEKDGTLHGTPVFAGEFNFTVKAETENEYATKDVVLIVKPRLAPTGNAPMVIITHEFADRGEEAAVQIRVSNNTGFENMELQVNLPDGLTFAGYTSHPLLDNQLLTRVDENGKISIAANETFREQGSILVLKFAIPDNHEYGFIPITAEIAGDAFTVTNGGVTVREVKPGDADGDGRVTSADSTVLARWLIGQHINIDIESANLNGRITPLTLTILSRLLIGLDV